MSLSDLFCVDRHKPHFLNLVKNKLDITFANEQEITSLIEAKKFDEVINFSKQLNKPVIVTREKKVQWQLMVMRLLKVMHKNLKLLILQALVISLLLDFYMDTLINYLQNMP